MVIAGVVQHRLRATTPLPLIKVVHALAVGARFASQDHTTRIAA
jgi:hypothetical protein